MTFETVVPEMLTRFLALQAECRAYMDEDEPLAYIAVGVVLLPELAAALARQDEPAIEAMCLFLEDAAVAGRRDARIANLFEIEVGDWLAERHCRETVWPYLGEETKRAL